MTWVRVSEDVLLQCWITLRARAAACSHQAAVLLGLLQGLPNFASCLQEALADGPRC